jgi:hypothetical protein
MSLFAKGNESTFKQVPPGTHLARLYRIVDLGKQESSFNGNLKSVDKAMFFFEVHGDDDEGNPLVTAKNEPMSISKTYTLSTNENSGLGKDIISWFAPEYINKPKYDVAKTIGIWCMISVKLITMETGKELTVIDKITATPTDYKKRGYPQPYAELKTFDINKPDMALFETFSEYLKAKIEASPDWKGRNAVAYTGGGVADLDDDVPF